MLSPPNSCADIVAVVESLQLGGGGGGAAGRGGSDILSCQKIEAAVWCL